MQNAQEIARRMEDRETAEGVIAVIDGKSYEVLDWSARGLALSGFQSPKERGDRLRAAIHTAVEGMDTSFDTGLFVVRADPESATMAAVFVDYDRDAALLLDRIFPLPE